MDSFAVGQRKILEQVARGAPLSETLAAIVALIESQASGMLCSVLLFDAERRTLHHGAAASLPMQYARTLDGSAIGPSAGSCGAAAYLVQRVVIEDIRAHPNWDDYRDLALSHGLRACWSTPIISAENDLLGTFAMYYREPRGPTAEELGWVDAATDLVAIAIVRDRAEQSLRASEARAQQLARLYSISSSIGEAIVRTTSIESLYETTCRIAVEKGMAKLAWILVYDPAARRVVCVARYGADDGYIDEVVDRLDDPLLNESLVGKVLRSGKPAVVNDIGSDPAIFWKDYPLARGLRACGVFPFRRGEQTFGVLLIYADSVGYFREEEVQMLNALADDISFAAESAQNELERRQVELALRQSEVRLRLLNELGDAMRALDDPERVLPVALAILGRHLGVSRCLYGIVGPGDHCVIPHDYTDGCPSMVGQYTLSQFGPRTLATLRDNAGPLVIRDAGTESTDEELEQLRRLGIQAMICCSLTRGGELRAFMVVHSAAPRDWRPNEITLVEEFVERCWASIEQRAAEERLRQNEALLRIAGRAAKFGGWRLEVPSLDVTWSDEVATIHDMPAGAAPTLKEALAFYAEGFRELVENSVNDCVREGKSFDIEAALVTAKKRTIWVRSVGHAQRDQEGNVVGVLGAFQDIDERRKLEEQLRHSQKMEAVGRLAGSVAHDFNNLLSVILSYSALVLQDLKPMNPLRADVEAIKRAGERASDLTRQLLAFSRRQVLSPRILDLNAAVRDAERMLLRLLGEDIELATRLAPNLSKVRVDPGQVDQVIMNLAVNARDAMPDGGKLTIETANVLLDEEYATEHLGVTPGPHVMLAVCDTGLGMDKDTLSHIFEPFYTTKEQGKGTGLGLSTVFGIVQQSGGTIWVYSEPGGGATFKVFFPSVRESTPPPPSLREPSQLQGSETILLVEDQDEVRGVACEILRRCGYHVLETKSPGEALLECERHPRTIHLLLTDVVMPRMNGRELAERLLQLRPTLKVLYMSGHTENGIVQHGILDSDVAYLQKPILPTALAARVRAVLDAPLRNKDG